MKRMDRTNLVAALSAAVSVSLALGTYIATQGPSVTVQTPTIVYVDAPCGRSASAGCYDTDRPNEIQVGPLANDGTIFHETQHFISNRDGLNLTECEVSQRTLDAGFVDGYAGLGYCLDGEPTASFPEHRNN